MEVKLANISNCNFHKKITWCEKLQLKHHDSKKNIKYFIYAQQTITKSIIANFKISLKYFNYKIIKAWAK